MNNFCINLSNNKIESLYINTDTTGYGKLYISNDEETFSYTGYIKNGLMDKSGLILYKYNKKDPTIIKYEGELSNNEYNGKGKLTYSNGDIFIGSFKNNMKHGFGKLYNAIGKVIIDNQWKDDIICDKIKVVKYYIGTNNIQVEGNLLNSVKVGPWIYYRENNIIDKIEFYKDTYNDENIVEILESSIHTNKLGYIINQKLNITKSKILDIDLVKSNNYYADILTHTNINIELLKNISIPNNDNITNYNYNLELNNNGKIHSISYYKRKLLYQIIFLSNKYLIKYNNKLTLYNIKKDKLSLYYDGELNKYYRPNGNGILYSDGVIQFKGIFINGRLKSGSKYSTTTPQYIMYDGTFMNNIPNGNGIYYNRNNIKIYEGTVYNNKYHENGISYWETTGLKHWDGKWMYGVKHGNGYLYDENETLICHCQFENNNILTIF